jgi:CheY-like chemotaxis protein
VISSVAGKRLALVGFESDEASDLTEVLESARAFTRTYDRSVTLPGHPMLRHSDGIVVKIPQAVPESEWTMPEHLERNDKPLLFVGTTEMFSRLTPLGQEKPYDFLISPWRSEEIVIRVSHMLSETMKRGGQKTVVPGLRSRVLVADDDETTTTLLNAALRKYAMECEIACNGGEAVEKARLAPPDAAILDVNMPHLGGFEVLAALKSDPRLCRIRVMMLTSRQQEADILRAFALGAEDYLVKPFSPMELIARLKRMLG